MKYAIYDFDGTLLQTQTVPFILQQWQLAKLPLAPYQSTWRRIRFRYVLMKMKIFNIHPDTFRAWAMQQVGSLLQTLSLNALSQFLDQLFEQSQKYLHKKVLKHIQKDKEQGLKTVLLSGNYDVFLERYRALGFDYIIGSSLFDEQGQPRQKIDIIIANKKIIELEKRLPGLMWDKTKAYADSHQDLPILTKVKEAICVTPTPALFKQAKRLGWRVIN